MNPNLTAQFLVDLKGQNQLVILQPGKSTGIPKNFSLSLFLHKALPGPVYKEEDITAPSDDKIRP